MNQKERPNALLNSTSKEPRYCSTTRGMQVAHNLFWRPARKRSRQAVGRSPQRKATKTVKRSRSNSPSK